METVQQDNLNNNILHELKENALWSLARYIALHSLVYHDDEPPHDASFIAIEFLQDNDEELYERALRIWSNLVKED